MSMCKYLSISVNSVQQMSHHCCIFSILSWRLRTRGLWTYSQCGTGWSFSTLSSPHLLCSRSPSVTSAQSASCHQTLRRNLLILTYQWTLACLTRYPSLPPTSVSQTTWWRWFSPSSLISGWWHRQADCRLFPHLPRPVISNCLHKITVYRLHCVRVRSWGWGQ